MKILVTGAAGFIGSNLCEFLLRKDYEVTGLDNFNDYYSPKIKRFNIEDFKNNPNFKMVEIDNTNREELRNLFAKQNFDSIIHIAAWAGVTPSIKRPDIYAFVNYDGTNNLAEFASQFGVKNFVFASTSSVYGNNNEVPFTEDMDTSYPAAPYPASKKAGEILLYTYAQNFDINVTILRFFNPIGPKLRPDMALPKLIQAVEYDREFPLYQNPNASSRDYTYIEDMLSAMETAVNRPLGYEIMNLGNSNPVGLIDMLKIVEKVTGKKVKTVEDPRAGQMEVTYANISKARELLDYNPSVNLEKMVELYYEWFLKQPEWYKKGEY